MVQKMEVNWLEETRASIQRLRNGGRVKKKKKSRPKSLFPGLVLKEDPENLVKCRVDSGATKEQLGEILECGYGCYVTHEVSVRKKEIRNTGFLYSLTLLLLNKHPYYSLEERSGVEDASIRYVFSAADFYGSEKEFGEDVIRWRKDNSVTQRTLAKTMNYGAVATISNWENGWYYPTNTGFTLFLLISDKHPRFILKQKRLSKNPFSVKITSPSKL